MIVYSALDEISDRLKENWNVFINDHPQGNVFQTHVMASFFEMVESYKSVLTILTEEDGEVLGVLVGVIQKEGNGIIGTISSRCIIWGGPLVKNNRTDVLKKLLFHFTAIVKKKVIYIQIRNLYDTGLIKEELISFGYKFEEHLNFINKLDNLELLIKRFNKSKQYQVKKGLESEAVIYSPTNRKDIESFYILLKNLYSSKVKKPLPNKSFFINAFEYLASKNSAFIKLIRLNNEIIGGILCFMDKNSVYDMYNVGLDRENKKVSPTVLAVYGGMKEGYDLSIPSFDFMGAGKPNEDYGVREFKGHFGGNMVNYGRYQLITKSFLYSMGVTGLKVINKLRLSTSK